MEVALRCRLMYKQRQETRKCQGGMCKQGTSALQSLKHVLCHHTCPLQGTHSPSSMPGCSSPLMPVLGWLLSSILIHFLYFYYESPWGIDVAVLGWKAGRCWEIKEWLQFPALRNERMAAGCKSLTAYATEIVRYALGRASQRDQC